MNSTPSTTKMALELLSKTSESSTVIVPSPEIRIEPFISSGSISEIKSDQVISPETITSISKLSGMVHSIAALSGATQLELLATILL